ncbi:glycerophosphodiester phosphodiesterase family protein [Sphingobacterium sp. UT-1RO-CII-1]|uniref:glycerophosphodiester phosphodiesterase family protein n=1 Tax=Sphingobacterium sp. UT-1RO-CII-1 TaxID=2995225 RepID=UPI00227AA4C2|nr:glycerophosphodiester phosphodiesterase family protein [Sphingobacterium sp. UT-1RO-CII-1]MCY4781285.1 glycerophosphodiester phosphodiesterase family protein [Sphingobacterium sp. UT-1RO-CII-1]
MAFLRKEQIILLGLALTFQSCALINKMNKEQDSFPSFSYEGHRGARGLYPENTIGAMKMAIDLPKVTTLEMDCHITKDKRVVVYHDHYINPKFVRYNNGKDLSNKDAKKLIYNYNYEELNQFDIGSKYYDAFPEQEKVKSSIALLSDLIEEAENYAQLRRSKPMFYNIETKSQEGKDHTHHPIPQDFVDLIMQVVIEKGIATRTVIQSFDKRTIQYLYKIYPQIKSSYLIDSDTKLTLKEIINDLGFKPYIISPHYKVVTKDFVKEAHQLGLKVIPWTVNDKNEIIRLKQLKVDGIISDYPNLF